MMTNGNDNQQDIVMVPVENLLLDYQNPRLVAIGEVSRQEDLLQELYREYYLDDLLVSLAHNGYFTEEPLIGVQTGSDNEGNPIYTIIEGNRRLTALRLLLFEADRVRVKAKDIPEPQPEILETLHRVPVKRYPSREDVTPYMGVRHIAGVSPWDALAKARYINQLVDSGYTIDAIKNMVGIKRGGVVQRWLVTLYALNQANRIADKPWQVAEKTFSFSFLYTALGYHRIRQYLEMDVEILNNPRPDPVSDSAHSKLIDHMADLYGTPDHPELRKVRESREIKKLAAVYATPEALDLLRAGYALADAYSRSVGEAEEMVMLTRDASLNLDKACGLAPHHTKSPEARKYTKRCLDSAQHLYDTLED